MPDDGEFLVHMKEEEEERDRKREKKVCVRER